VFQFGRRGEALLDDWVQRMGQSMAVGQQFRKFLGY
jgi:hypothetical protein